MGGDAGQPEGLARQVPWQVCPPITTPTSTPQKTWRGVFHGTGSTCWSSYSLIDGASQNEELAKMVYFRLYFSTQNLDHGGFGHLGVNLTLLETHSRFADESLDFLF